MKKSSYTTHEQKARVSRIVGVPREQERFIKSMKRQHIYDSGIVSAAIMILGALAALIVANTGAYEAVHRFMSHHVGFTFLGFTASFSFEYFVNDFLMAIFFLLVGIELKYEFTVGQLKNPRQALLPIIAAIGGVCIPALIYTVINLTGEPGQLRGWAIPMATDIAFALGVIALLGDRISPATKVFFSTLAIADDIMAILVIALFYGSSIDVLWLLASVACIVPLFILNKRQVYSCVPYIMVGLILWVCMFKSGIHATIAGVVLAFFLPSRSSINVKELAPWMKDYAAELQDHLSQDQPVLSQHDFLRRVRNAGYVMKRVVPPLERVENAISVPVHFLILPLFAFVNAQVRFVGTDVTMLLTSTITLGTFIGAVVGKPVGIIGATLLADRCKIAKLPEGMDLIQLIEVGILGGLGFTMSILIATMAFESAELVTAAKVAILLGSVITSVIGMLFLLCATHRKQKSA